MKTVEKLNKKMIDNFFKYQDDLIEGYLDLVNDLGEDDIKDNYPRLKIAMDKIMKCAEE